jgi:hypothetical protein
MMNCAVYAYKNAIRPGGESYGSAVKMEIPKNVGIDYIKHAPPASTQTKTVLFIAHCAESL